MKTIFAIALLLLSTNIEAQVKNSENPDFCIAKDGQVATILVDENDWNGVIRAAKDLGNDVYRVTGVASPVVSSSNYNNVVKNCIIVGTIGKNKLIDTLIRQKKLNVKRIKDHWEGFIIDWVDGNLVIAGNDKRGTIYGIYEISKSIGVSPWYWMADAPVVHKDEVYFNDYKEDWPAVKYRGIFINDEWPSLEHGARNTSVV